jgi:hypothetical protein
MAKTRKKPETRNDGPLALESNNQSRRSGLVAETLFMAVLLHALLALVFVNFRFTAFLNGAHGVCVRG